MTDKEQNNIIPLKAAWDGDTIPRVADIKDTIRALDNILKLQNKLPPHSKLEVSERLTVMEGAMTGLMDIIGIMIERILTLEADRP